MKSNNVIIFIDKAIKELIILGILITPLLNFGEVIALIKGTLESQTYLYTPIYIKVLKDIVMIFLLILMFLKVLFNKVNLIYYNLIFFIILFLLSNIFFTILSSNDNYILFGLRWFYPFFLIIMGLKTFEKDYLSKRFENSLLIVFIIHFSFQIYELFFASSWFGETTFEVLSTLTLKLRNPGIFLLPNTGAFFSIIVFFWFLFYYNRNNTFKKIIILLSITSILLTNSGTGVVALTMIILIFLLPKKFLAFIPFILIPLTNFLLIYVSKFRGEDYVSVSGGTRLEIFRNTLNESGLLSSNFGYYTNVSNLLSNSGSIMDSTFSSLLGNLGIIGFAIIIFVLFFLLLIAYINLDKVKLSFLVLFLSFSATTIIFEAYPMNLLLSLLVCKLYTKKGSTHEHRL